MADFRFVTIWKIPAPLEPVWNALTDAESYPSWWHGVERVVVLEPGSGTRIGRLVRQTWKSKLPYRLIFDTRIVRIEPMSLFEVQAEGELQGTGLMRFSNNGALTTFRYDWNVRTTKQWMNFLAPVARPIFAWNHNVIMDWGAQGLGRKLGGVSVATSEG